MIEKRRYRKISVRMWGDEKFRRLTRPKPNGQTLWFYLLTGPHTSALPGLFVSGEASLAEALGWPLKEFRRCFKELSDQRMALADWTARVVWLPKAMTHNAPESPNVVKSWRAALDEIPECETKRVAAQTLKGFIQGLGEGFQKALGQGWPGVDRPTPVNQEQEQRQEQEQEQEQTSAEWSDFDQFWFIYPKHKAKADAEKAWKAIKDRPPLAVILGAIQRQSQSYDWRKEKGKFVPYPATWIRARRWEDDDAMEPEAPAAVEVDWFQECQQLHGLSCNGRYNHELRMQAGAVKEAV